ncbi:unnamed protein product [Rodentolepis nana]|uniref:Uncharacterized protein n=1 Tax=Rodentolepis nana TaxID=102285 RepID=A0A0R3T7Z9_RODNA|nr:unnamed protein product [Rodentolepis nana]
MDRSMSFQTMKAFIRREFQTSRCNELKDRTKEKQWTVVLSDIPDWPRIEVVAEFRRRTRRLLGKTSSQIGRGNGDDPPDSVSSSKDNDGKPEILGRKKTANELL